MPDDVLPLGQHLLHLQQPLLGLRHQRAVRKLHDELAILFFGAPGVGRIAVRLLHLLVMDVGDLHLRFRRLGHIGEEGDEVLVLAFGLRHGGGAAFLVPGIANRQLGAGHILRIGIGIDQRLQAQPGDIVLVVLHRIHGAVEQHLVWLFGIDIGNRVLRLLALLAGLGRLLALLGGVRGLGLIAGCVLGLTVAACALSRSTTCGRCRIAAGILRRSGAPSWGYCIVQTLDLCVVGVLAECSGFGCW